MADQSASLTPDHVMISLRRVSKRFAGSRVDAVKDLSLDIREGEIVVLVGPSGCGKTTTMRMVNRLIEPTTGTITVDGRNVLEQDPVQLRRNIGYVIQSTGLMPHRTVVQNIATVPKLLGWSSSRITSRIDELTQLFQLDAELTKRYPSELSGGQQQRVGVARALAADPPVMLMDEPFVGADPIVRARLQDEFLRIQRRLKKTIVFVTHDIDEAIKMADRIAILNESARVEQFASPKEILRNPANEYVEKFVGAERGLKRLALIKVAEIPVEEGPVVPPDASMAEAEQEILRSGFDWTSVVDRGVLLGWVSRSMLNGADTIGEAGPRPFSAWVTVDDSLRQALDSIVTSATNVAVVVDEANRYRGILTLNRLSQEIVE
jgi:osmoprotectant transport system ATP-binding protein